jgi:hypothetical protein
MYYVTSVAGAVHSVTVLACLPQVMGERRITMPLYLGAGVINMINAVQLAQHPDLKHLFLLWGSVNTFIYVRYQVFLLCMTNIDWCLLYTYSILAAAFTAYPLSGQPGWVYVVAGLPILYSPFHEYVCDKFGWEEEDMLKSNGEKRDGVVKDFSAGHNARTTLIRTMSGKSAANKQDEAIDPQPLPPEPVGLRKRATTALSSALQQQAERFSSGFEGQAVRHWRSAGVKVKVLNQLSAPIADPDTVTSESAEKRLVRFDMEPEPEEKLVPAARMAARQVATSELDPSDSIADLDALEQLVAPLPASMTGSMVSAGGVSSPDRKAKIPPEGA